MWKPSHQHDRALYYNKSGFAAVEILTHLLWASPKYNPVPKREKLLPLFLRYERVGIMILPPDK
jgi:hypothetical protein